MKTNKFEEEYLELIDMSAYEGYTVAFLILMILAHIFYPILIFYCAIFLLLMNIHGCRKEERTSLYVMNLVFLGALGFTFIKYRYLI